MVKLAKATSSPLSKHSSATVASYAAATLFVTVTLLQLFRFEHMPDVVREYELFGYGAEALLIASGLVVVQVAALPFLLRLHLSTLARSMSMVAGWVAVLAWLVIATWVSFRGIWAVTDGFLELTIGWWYVWFWIGTGALIVWVSWGQWPLRATKQAAYSQKQSAQRSS